ncbi:MAG: DUF932 domain-containing protein [Gemmataceae bacterium]
MATSALVLHRGAHSVTAEELRGYRPPASEGRWHPIAHARVLEVVGTTLREAGYEVKGERLALARDGHRFFGTLDLGTPLGSGVSLAVGVRNSTDKSFPLGFCAGSRVFVCDNLAFRSELLVRRKHTLNGERNFVRAIGSAVTTLAGFRESEAARVRRLLHTTLTDDQADALILRSWERGIVGARELPRVLKEWRTPSFEEFEPRTAWSLLNAFTGALRDRAASQPAAYATQTIRLNGLLTFRGEAAQAA